MRSPNRVLGAVVGALHLVVGIAGFFVAADDFFDRRGGLLAGVLSVNPAQDVLHVLLGAGILACALLGLRAAKIANTAGGTAFLVLGLAGLFTAGTPANVLALSGAGNVLHFASAVVLLAAGLGADRDVHTPVTG